VADLYATDGIDPRALAWGNLALIAGSIYGPRAAHFLFGGRQSMRAAVA